MKRYYFEYKGNSAVVYSYSTTWGDREVARFALGRDAQEYVNYKNGKIQQEV